MDRINFDPNLVSDIQKSDEKHNRVSILEKKNESIEDIGK